VNGTVGVNTSSMIEHFAVDCWRYWWHDIMTARVTATID